MAGAFVVLGEEVACPRLPETAKKRWVEVFPDAND